MNLEWLVEDDNNTLGHATKLEIDGITNISPLHALLKRDLDIAQRTGTFDGLKNTNMIVAGESLQYPTFNVIGHNSLVTEALLKRIKEKIIRDKINLIHLRIPESYNINEKIISVDGVSEIQASGLVGVQLEADASAIIPPLNSGLNSISVFKRVYNRTKVEIQTLEELFDCLIQYLSSSFIFFF